MSRGPLRQKGVNYTYNDKQNQVQNLKCQLSRAIIETTMIPL